MDNILMKCGCAATGYRIKGDKKIKSCIVHSCTDPADNQPDLSLRTAKCTYFGRNKPNRRYANDECNYGCRGEKVCKCGKQPSSLNLAFFKYKPDSPEDEFYCGCFGWD